MSMNLLEENIREVLSFGVTALDRLEALSCHARLDVTKAESYREHLN
jgi:hypothetical protein